MIASKNLTLYGENRMENHASNIINCSWWSWHNCLLKYTSQKWNVRYNAFYSMVLLCFADVSLCRTFFSDFIIRNRCSCNVGFKFFISLFFSFLNCLVMLFKVHCEVRHPLHYKWSCSVSFCCCTYREFWLLFFALMKKLLLAHLLAHQRMETIGSVY